MCVLVVAEKRRPTEDELEKMALTNPDGGGIAWRDKSHESLPAPDIIKWEKGLTLEEMKVYCADAPLPFVFHFRIASCGGKLPELTHPFPIEREVRAVQTGETKGYVLFHNGHWAPWKDKGIDGAIKNKIKVPEGKWSDTRVMAWLAHLHGPGILELIDEKVILFGTSKIEIFHPDGWFRINDLLVSNRLWEHVYNRQQIYNNRVDDDITWDHCGGYDTGVCRQPHCVEASLAGSWYCAQHQPACRWYNCVAPRLIGSEHCAEHQPACLETGCNKPRKVNERYCAIHLTKQLESRLPIPFRPGVGVAKEGPDLKADLEATAEGPIEAPLILTDPKLQAESRWARSINPKHSHKESHVNGNGVLALVQKDITQRFDALLNPVIDGKLVM